MSQLLSHCCLWRAHRNGSGKYVQFDSIRDVSTYASMEAAPASSYGIKITKPITRMSLYYFVGLHIPGTSSNTGDGTIYIRKNGSNIYTRNIHIVSYATGRDDFEDTITLNNLNVGDVISMYIYNDGPRSLRIAWSGTYMTADVTI